MSTGIIRTTWVKGNISKHPFDAKHTCHFVNTCLYIVPFGGWSSEHEIESIGEKASGGNGEGFIGEIVKCAIRKAHIKSGIWHIS